MQADRTSSRLTKSSSASSLEEQRKAELAAACAAAAEAAAELAATKVAAVIAEKYEKHIAELKSDIADQIATRNISPPPSDKASPPPPEYLLTLQGSHVIPSPVAVPAPQFSQPARSYVLTRPTSQSTHSPDVEALPTAQVTQAV